MNEIYYATSNPVKFEEAHQFFHQRMPNISLQQYAADIPEIQTLDQKLIAIAKAQEAWQRLQKPVLAEDAGIYFSKYNQFPGTLSKFVYQAIGMEGVLKLVDANDAASFQVYLVYYYGNNQYQVFKGICVGSIKKATLFTAAAARPFDDIFIPEGTHKTYSELRHHNELSPFNYRVKALEQFVAWYEIFSRTVLESNHIIKKGKL